MKKLIFLILFICVGYSFALPKFSFTAPDTNAVRISAQDSVAAYDSSLIFVVQRKLSGIYRWKKMYFYQLKNILNTTLSLSNLQIPRLSGTPTTNIALKLFATDTLYKADFNYNFRKIDSLAIFFNTNDFRISGDTVSLRDTILTAKTFSNSVNLNSTTTLGAAEKFNASLGYLILPNAGGSNANAIYFDGTDVRFQTFPGNYVLAGLSHANTWTGTNIFSNSVNINHALTFTGVPVTSTALDATGKSLILLGGTPGTYNLQTITGGTNGQIIVLYGSSTAWTIKDYVSGSDNIRLKGGLDFYMGTYDTLLLMYSAGDGVWVELSRSDN